jgi:hypothetical protein
MNILHEIFRPPERRSWLLWIAGIWLSILLGPFAYFGENWGMIFYIITMPFSGLLKTFYEDLGTVPYVLLVALNHCSFGMLIGLILYNTRRMYQEAVTRNKPQPPTPLPL